MRYVYAAIFLAYASYIAWWSVSSGLLMWLVLAALPMAAALGLCLHQRWSRFAALATSVASIVVFIMGWSATADIREGVWPYADIERTIISLVPAVVWLAFWILLPIAVDRTFNRRARGRLFRT